MQSKIEHVYLIREREFISLNEPIYKLGKTKRSPSDRMKGYPKGSEVILFTAVDDCDEIERKMMVEFKQKFTAKPEIGREYFQGSYKEMRDCINQIVESEDIISDSEDSATSFNDCLCINQTIKCDNCKHESDICIDHWCRMRCHGCNKMVENENHHHTDFEVMKDCDVQVY